ncbi:MAG: uroporphyrinogen decarboxylase family protein [Planctomycetota bacterium]|nr:uroporphyrinogen decarboxylase family protein [Planctomycetota bacterium]MDP6506554.1 uroporphyrinogen decarboxylase family protein [Planctomycetota bacterium]
MAQTLSHRERVLLALDHKETDRVPIAMVCSGINRPAKVTLEDFLQRERGMTVDDYLQPLIDIRDVRPRYIGPPLAEGTDMWGVHRSLVSYGADAYNEIDIYPLAGAEEIGDLVAHNWPSPDWFDYSELPARIEEIQKDGEFCLMTANGNIFETSWYMRGFERIFMDVVDNPDFVHALFERVASFYLEYFRRILTAAEGKIDLVFTADDIGGQEGLLMSLRLWEEHIKPYHLRLNSLIHEFGAKVIYHSDGAVMEAVPGLIDMGIDILQALQFDAKGMDPSALKENYGDVLCFEGGVSVQHTLPFGTPEDVRAEVEQLTRVLGKSGGYILGPSHAIQAGTPPENIVAMFDTAAIGSGTC